MASHRYRRVSSVGGNYRVTKTGGPERITKEQAVVHGKGSFTITNVAAGGATPWPSPLSLMTTGLG